MPTSHDWVTWGQASVFGTVEFLYPGLDAAVLSNNDQEACIGNRPCLPPGSSH